MPVNVAVYGLGPIGSLIAKKVLEKKDLSLVAAFDVAPEKVGKDLGDVLQLGNRVGLVVEHDINSETVLKNNNVDIVLHSTSTYLDRIYPQIVRCIKSTADVISTSETLCNPWYRYPELATLIDEMAKKYCVTVLGTGVNPGFIFDTLPATLTSVCTKIEKIHAVRSLDASKRRFSFQKKYGLSLSVDQFNELMNKGQITAHVGYAESIDMLASALGIKLDKIIEGQEPLIASKPLKTDYFNISIGQVSGIHGYGIGYLNNKEFIKIELFAEVGREEYEEIRIEGEPSLTWRSNGTSGDIATAAMVINMIPKVLNAKPGLIRMLDIPLPSAFLKLDLVKD
ncbi:MAG: dihydrodipicolinate reductase [Nitrososphaeria archaeon]